MVIDKLYSEHFYVCLHACEGEDCMRVCMFFNGVSMYGLVL